MPKKLASSEPILNHTEFCCTTSIQMFKQASYNKDERERERHPNIQIKNCKLEDIEMASQTYKLYV